MEEPLLGPFEEEDLARSSAGPGMSTTTTAAAAAGPPRGTDLRRSQNARWRQHLLLAVRVIQPWEIVFLVSLGLLNIYLGQLVGYLAGDFYACLAAKDAPAFDSTMRKQVLFALACCVTFGSVQPLSELLSFRWRKRLTLSLHAMYCTNSKAYYSVRLDNPDQRIQRDADFLCKALAQVGNLVCVSPFKILYYTWLSVTYFGAKTLGCLYAYFALTLIAQKLIMDNVTPLVVRRERAEAEFRQTHFRLKGHREEIAMAGEAIEARERYVLDESLGGALRAQRKLVVAHWALALSSSLIDYLGVVVNYSMLGFAIFRGIRGWDVPEKDLPKMISQSSFVTFQLIYAFSQISDTARAATDLLGYAERVGELIGFATGEGGAGDPEDPKKGGSMAVIRRAALGGRPMEWSVHEAEGPVLEAAVRTFPDFLARPNGGSRLVAVSTFQCATDKRGGARLASAAEMNAQHRSFLALESEVWKDLTDSGHFCDSVDPLTGCATHTRLGQRYSEARGAEEILRYPTVFDGAQGEDPCPVVDHPRFGTACYPATIFTDAPAHVAASSVGKVLARLRLVSGGSGALLRCEGLGVAREGKFVFRGLSFELGVGEGVFVRGPSGSGKTCLVRALCGLEEPGEGSVHAPPLGCVMVLSQSPLLVHGGNVADQVAYPASAEGSEQTIQRALEGAGGDGLAARIRQRSGSLSEAETQMVLLARVLYHRPLLAFLDESMSALSAEERGRACGALAEAGVAFVLTGRDALGGVRTLDLSRRSSLLPPPMNDSIIMK